MITRLSPIPEDNREGTNVSPKKNQGELRERARAELLRQIPDNPVIDALKEARMYLKETGFTMTKFQMNATQVSPETLDDALVDMVRVYNKQSRDNKVLLYNGVNGDTLVEPEPVSSRPQRIHIFVRLGRRIVPLTQATLIDQLDTRVPSIPRAMANKMKRNNVRRRGDMDTMKERFLLERTVKEHVQHTRAPMTVISYPSGRQAKYHAVNPDTQIRVPKQYLYQGVMPEEYRRRTQKHVYVLSAFPPLPGDGSPDIEIQMERDEAPPNQGSSQKRRKVGKVSSLSTETVESVSLGIGLLVLGIVSSVAIL